MSNICRRCGHPVQFGLVPLKAINNGYCHFCIREFKALTDEMDKSRERLFVEWGKELAERIK